jgi:hypothetical protein
MPWCRGQCYIATYLFAMTSHGLAAYAFMGLRDAWAAAFFAPRAITWFAVFGLQKNIFKALLLAKQRNYFLVKY